MKVIKCLSEIEDHDIAITIGNFDGVHSGHQKILKDINEACKNNGQMLVVITFVPHPGQILNPQSNFLLNSYNERRELLSDIGIEVILELEFSRDFSTMEPAEFMEKYILVGKNIKSFYVGHDFAFGANKKGDHNFVKEYCSKRGIEVNILSKHLSSNLETSSSIIRNEIDAGNIEKANKLLGREFYVSGRVIKGEGRGKKIGIPTANLGFESDRKVPKKGVYVSRCTVGAQVWHSITNIGNNPTFNDTNDLFLESHIFDFDNDIYGEELKVEFLERIRDEKKFSSVNDLISQIKTDIEFSKKYFLEND